MVIRRRKIQMPKMMVMGRDAIYHGYHRLRNGMIGVGVLEITLEFD